MSEVQRIVKYLAIAFAFFLIFSIISGIISTFMAIGNLLNHNKDSILENFETIEISDDETISTLDIDIVGANIIIKAGEKFQIKTNSKYIEVKQEMKKISIKENENSWLYKGKTADLIIYIPINFIFQKVSIETGAGLVEIESLSTKDMDLDLGAGKAEIEKLTVFNQVEIDSGAGEVKIQDANLNNLDLNMGVGKVTMNTKLSGRSTIDHGVGALTLNLIGEKDDYQIHLNKGLGSITIQEEALDNQTIGTGSNYLDIDGGIGKIDIHYTNNN